MGQRAALKAGDASKGNATSQQRGDGPTIPLPRGQSLIQYHVSANRLGMLSRHRQNVEEARHARRMKNGLQKLKGTWSYDWSIPLRLLLKVQLEHAEREDLERIDRGIADAELAVSKRDAIHYRDVSVFDIPRPQEWTRNRFMRHVGEIAGSKVSISLQRFLYSERGPEEFKPSDAHVWRVQAALEALFADESLQPYWSTVACERALDFYLRQNMLSSSRRLIKRMRAAGVPIWSSTMNRILWSTAFHHDLGNFTAFLFTMLSMQVPFNNGTWCAFLCAVESKSVKLRIFREMKEQGILKDISSLRMAVAELTRLELQKQPETAFSNIPQFFAHMDRRYGNQWLSEEAGNIICDELCSHGRLDQITAVLQTMQTRNMKPSGRTLAVLLTNAMRAEDPHWALQTLQDFAEVYDVEPQQAHMEPLFMLGWRTRSYNVCRLVWHHACTSGWVTYPMKRLVLQSLMRNSANRSQNAETFPGSAQPAGTSNRSEPDDRSEPLLNSDPATTTASHPSDDALRIPADIEQQSKPERGAATSSAVHSRSFKISATPSNLPPPDPASTWGPAAAWPHHAGKVIAGVGVERASVQLRRLAEWTPAGEARTAPIAQAKTVLEQDLLSSVRREPPTRFVKLFEVAVGIDAKWGLQEMAKGRWTLLEKMKNAMHVPCHLRKMNNGYHYYRPILASGDDEEGAQNALEAGTGPEARPQR